MMAAHLGARAHDLVDGRLDDNGRELALAHLMGCARCQEEVRDLRAVKSLLAGLGTPAPDLALTGGLASLGGELAPEPVAIPSPRPRPVLGRPGWRSGLAAGALTLVGASAVTLMLVAPGPSRTAQQTPTGSFTVIRTGGSGSVDSDVGAGVTASLRTRP